MGEPLSRKSETNLNRRIYLSVVPIESPSKVILKNYVFFIYILKTSLMFLLLFECIIQSTISTMMFLIGQ